MHLEKWWKCKNYKMINKLKGNKPLILDCTLRDGGYYTNWDFEDKLVDAYISSMNKLPVDFIEIGYRSTHKKQYNGAYFYLPEFIIERIKSHTKKDLAIILNEKDVRKEDAEALLNSCLGKIRLIRLAVNPENLDRGIALASKIKEIGFEVALNLMYASKWPLNYPLLPQIKAIDAVCDYFYVVDSYGGLFPEDVRRIFNYLKPKFKIKLGFHGHNNLEMALANTLEAINCGANIVDATIDGMGRGAGNLKTELLLSVLYKKIELDVNFDVLHKVRETFFQLKPKYQWGTNLPYMVSGSFSLPQNKLMDQIHKRYFSLNAIIKNDIGAIRNTFSTSNVAVFEPEFKSSSVLIVGGGKALQNHKAAMNKFLSIHPKIPVIFASSKNVAVFREVKNPQFHLIPGKELQRLNRFLSKTKLQKRSFIIPPAFNDVKSLHGLEYYKLAENKNYCFPESVTEYCLQVALAFKATKVYLVGYDGYGNIINKAQKELFEENETIFRHYKNEDFKIISLTPSEYTIEKSSVYSFLL
ncbi:4-hydroxy 2-oxovalerate aldolase [Salegentibacter holothuriorum]|uniref:4-hydroxy 2-oxovalerate aldolase n=1 Tax=Salegentibacter holothuriorum TaxID=241145 RepID=A0A1T5ANU1_9FLAO|nr:aldolase catalytic domain-containing protein [Salegentibacter holothuriorum]SKB36721.1 4-hydroxy 2-oxovalerate aldolase [Salegentibacter holothuriorum]